MPASAGAPDPRVRLLAVGSKPAELRQLNASSAGDALCMSTLTRHPQLPVGTGTMNAGDGGRTTPVCDVEIVIPVYNEEVALAICVERITAYLKRTRFPFTYRITIADNASTDGTWTIAQALAEQDHVRAIHLDAKGRGRALKQAWLESDATVLTYMDVDLSTDLSGFLPLITPLLTGHSDIAIGTRLARSARVRRGAKREIISRSYNLILKSALRVHFSDAQCGFKGIRNDCARMLLPLVEDNAWFFDTELLVLAERAGLRIHEVPVDWVDDPDSRVDIVQTATDDLKGVWRIMTALLGHRIPLSELRSGARCGH
jgi:glycosyltransferase involved in cell wall biosynthesis